MPSPGCPWACIAGPRRPRRNIRSTPDPDRSRRGPSSVAGDGQVVEQGPGVGLGPEADLAGLGEGRVLDFEVFLAVEVDLDPIALHGHPEPGPAVVVLDVGVLERRRALAVDHLVDPEVVLEVI